METETPSFGTVLRRLRLAAGLTQDALAERAGISARSIQGLERGDSLPQRETARRLAEALRLGRTEHAQFAAAAGHPAPAARRVGTPAGEFAVFVCSARGDSAFVARLLADLATRGITVVEDRSGLRPGTADVERARSTVIRTCRAVLLVASPDARQSRAVTAALAVAEMYGCQVVPVWASGEQWLDCVPLSLSDVPCVDARGDRYPAAVGALVAALAQPAAVPRAAATDVVTALEAAPRNPYKGLRAFGEEDANDFFGRNALVDTLLEALRATVAGQVGSARLLAVLGPSGSGKSSVVRAGLLPRLKGDALPGSAGWVYLDPIVPGTHPLEALTVTLVNQLGGAMQALHEDLAADSARGLHLLASRLATRPESKVVLVIDQYEELFTLTASEEERRQFIDILLTAVAEPRGPLLAVLTLRADCYDRLLAYPNLGALVHAHSQVMLPMNVADLRAVIEHPAALPDVRLSFEHNLVGDLLFEVGSQMGALPLLEFTLDQLFARREGRLLSVAAYHEIGGVRGALTTHTEATFAQLPTEEHRCLARALFLRLIDPGLTEQDTTRRRAALSELTLPNAQQTALLSEVATAFVTARLLTTSEHAGLTTLEVSHEALIREWGRLAGWLHDAREDIRRQQTISADAAEWERRGRPTDNLYRGVVLQEAQAWAARNAASAAEVAFLEAGMAEGLRRAEDERAARERELALALQAAAANRLAAVRSRTLAGTLALFLLVATGLSVYAFKNAAVASEARARAAVNARVALANARAARLARATAVDVRNTALASLSRVLALQAEELVASQPQIALLLGVEAGHVWNTTQARTALLQVVDHNPRLLSFLHGDTNSVNSVAFSPDGTLLASGSDDGTIRLWDVARRRQRGPPLTGQLGPVDSVAFSPDGTLLASGSSAGTIQLWDVARRKTQGPPLTGHSGIVLTVAFSPDGTLLASGGVDGTIRLWDVAHGQPLGPPLASGDADDVNSVVFSPDGRTLASGNGDGTVRLWDVARHQQRGAPITLGRTVGVLSVAFSPDGTLLASGSVDGTVRLWDVTRRRQHGPPLSGHTDDVNSVAFSPDGQTLASGSADMTIRLWDVASGQPLAPPLTGHTGAVNSIAFSPDGRTLASGSADTTIALWDVDSGQPLAEETGPVNSVAFSHAGILASSGADGTIRLWDVTRRRLIGPPLASGGTGPVNSVAFSPKGTVLAAGNVAGTIRLWDITRHRLLGSPLSAGGTGPVDSVAFSPDGTLLAAGSADGAIRLWDVVHHQQRGPPLSAEGTGPVDSVAFSPDGTLLAAGSADGAIRLWDVVHHQQRGPPLTGHYGPVNSVAFSPDGKTLASGSADTTVRLWDVASGEQRGLPFTGHSGPVNSVAFSPDGKTLASGSDDMTIRLWDVASGQLLAPPLTGHTYGVTSVAFSPGGQTLASGSTDATIRLWHVTATSPVQQACQIANRNLTRAEWRHYLGDFPYQQTCPGLPTGT